MTAKRILEPGSQLGRYELLTPIAQGGMASVWAARQSGSHGFRKTVAMKTMLPSLSDDPQFERMFLGEARLAMRMHHPNVVEILDLGEEEGFLYIVMEWIDGEPLSALMKSVEKVKEGPMPWRIGVHICLKACMGLHAAHEVTDDDDNPVGIVHRDVSPQNVMVTYDGHVKVVDFGVAKSQSESGMTATGQFKGKVPYMSPEQAEGRAIDRRTDIFAMGTLLYRLTVGQHPFSGPNDVATLHHILHRDPAPIREQVPDFPERLEAVIMRCLHRDANARFESMESLVTALEAVTAELGPSVTESELGTLVKSTLGERRKERRGAMREAAKSLGWAVATSESHPRVSVSSLSISRALLTPPGPHALTPTGTSTTGGLLIPGADSVPTKNGATGAHTRSKSKRLAVSIAFGLLAGAAMTSALVLLARKSRETETIAKPPSNSTAPTVTASTTGAAEEGPIESAPASAAPQVSASAKVGGKPPVRFGRPLPSASARVKPTGTPTGFGSGPDMGF